MAATKGKVQTVLGLVDPGSLGATMMHEHMHLDFNTTFIPPEGEDKAMAECDFTLENSGWIRQNPYGHRSNVTFDDAAVASCIVDELKTYKANGGGSIVELTNYGIARNADRLVDHSRGSGVHIVCGTGYYMFPYQSSAVKALSVEAMTARCVRDLTEGCPEAPEVKCGIIGEVGSNWPIHEFERRAIQAAAEAQQVTGAPVNFHPGRHEAAPAEVIRVFQEAGGDASRAVMSHLDRSIYSSAGLAEFARLGCFLEYDLFGIETSWYQLAPHLDMPSDAQRIRLMVGLVEEGCEDRLLVSHDIHTKHRLTKFGGHGFSHILKYVVPMMKQRGLSDQVIDKILVQNPKAVLQFQK